METSGRIYACTIIFEYETTREDSTTEFFSQIFAKCGFNRKTSKAIMHGPIDMAGGGFTPLRFTAGSGYVIHFMKNWRTGNEIIGKSMQIVYAWYQSHAGTTFPLLEQPQIMLPYLKGTVISAMILSM